jgi:queuine tRNA-ribosyltransferase
MRFPNGFSFQVLERDPNSQARCGRLHTRHGVVETPAFMPVGTQATVKGLLPEQLRSAGAQIVLANTYHLALRPGGDVVADLGGLHRMMGWEGPILTDSGGFQVYSLAERAEITDAGLAFRSHIDGSRIDLTPERAVRIQEQLGADIIMCLDICPAYTRDRDRVAAAVQRTTAWARRCLSAQQRCDQALFGIVQGATDRPLREESAQALCELALPGYAVGGLSVGETMEEMQGVLECTTALLPAERPRYLMGVGRPRDILAAVAHGVDLFDCVLPTRNGRNASAFTWDGPVRLRNAQHQRSREPLDPQCSCPACRQFSRGYLRHLFQSDEMLGPILVSLHNVSFYQQFMGGIRRAIAEGSFAAYRADTLARLGA